MFLTAVSVLLMLIKLTQACKGLTGLSKLDCLKSSVLLNQRHCMDGICVKSV